MDEIDDRVALEDRLALPGRGDADHGDARSDHAQIGVANVVSTAVGHEDAEGAERLEA